MGLSKLTDRQAVLSSIRECDDLGEPAFLEKHGFKPAREYFLVHDGKHYPSKAIVGVAHGYQYPDEGILQAKDFTGGKHTSKKKLNELGFEVIYLNNESPASIDFPALKRASRHREYDEHSLVVRSEVVKAYLFDGLSHRSLDEKVIGVDPTYSRGYQSMGILHYLGLVDAHKGIFAGMSVKAAVQNLEELADPDLGEVLEHLRYKPTKPYTAPTPSIDLQKLNQEHEKAVRKSLDDDDEKRQKRLKKAETKPPQVQVTTTAYKRNADVVAEVLKRANGICEKCDSSAPFSRAKDGTPYLEVHHWKPLGDDGEDTVENAGALCPNCHREEHFG